MFSLIKKIFASFSKKERFVFGGALIIFLIASLFAINAFFKNKTKLVPISGGDFTEGALGQPIFINPILSGNNEVDDSIAGLVFSDLKTMADSYKLNADQTTLNIRLKANIFWQDGQNITSDDVIFTINAIENSNLNSPLASTWKGIRAERISEREFNIISPLKYAYFEGIVLKLRPIPKHIFGSIPIENLLLSNYNLEPIASGPFKFGSLKKRRDGFITDYSLNRNEKYFGQKPYLNAFSFKFYSSEDGLIKAFNIGEIDGFALNQYDKEKDLSVPYQTIETKIPRYYAIFLNPYNNPLLKDEEVRLALDWAIDKKKIIGEVFGGRAILADNPIFETNFDLVNEEGYSPEKARGVLLSSGWQENSAGTWEKTENEKTYSLEFVLTVYPSPFLAKTAEIIKQNWEDIGIKTEINPVNPETFAPDVVGPRNYEMLLFGNIYGANTDPFSFWHSSQKFSPGLNLSLYEDKNADYLIEIIRSENDPQKRRGYLLKLGSLIYEDKPAIFLYSPYYIYVANKSLRGFNEEFIPLSSSHLDNIGSWHMKTARVLK